jgi:hypothetical protein
MTLHESAVHKKSMPGKGKRCQAPLGVRGLASHHWQLIHEQATKRQELMYQTCSSIIAGM